MKIKFAALFILLQIILTSGCSLAEDQTIDNKSKNQNAQTYIVGSGEPAESVAKALNNASVIWDPIHEGSRYYEQGKYDLAIATLNKVLELNPQPSEKGVIKSILGDAYEAKGDYQLALNEINWQIAHKPRHENPEYVDKLLARKQNLEKLLTAKNQSLQNQTQ